MKSKELYAKVIGAGTKAGIFIACLTLPLYIFGVIPPIVAVSEIQEYWKLSPSEFAAKAGTVVGPGRWLMALGSGDGLAALPVLFFCLLPIVAYGAMIARAERGRDRIYTVMMILEIILIVLVVFGLI